jgi:demethylmenaquinone methyltransferase/2-methoxy-6-polyprenyl-1,4-benzoquinol methylase
MLLPSYENLIDPILKNVRQIIPGFADMMAGNSALDVCCGTGAQVIEYGKYGILATGIDKEQNMLNVALRNKGKFKLVNIDFHLADATALPFNNNSFDYVSISFGLHDKERDIISRIIAEMKRVVKRDGSLIFIDFQVPLPNNIWAMFARAIEFLAGGSHYQGFRDFIINGGIKNILQDHILFDEKICYLKNGVVEVVKARLNTL